MMSTSENGNSINSENVDRVNSENGAAGADGAGRDAERDTNGHMTTYH